MEGSGALVHTRMHVEPFFGGFGFLINHSRTMSDTSVQEMKPARNDGVEYLNISVLMCAKQSVCLQGRL